MSDKPQRLKLRRIPGFSLFRFESLWFDQDHLVVCAGYGLFLPFMEEYRHFFFRDIQGIQVATSQRHHAVSVILGILGFLALVACALAPFVGSVWKIWIAVFGVIAAVLLVLLSLHLLKGPACTVLLKTAVQTTLLRSLQRMSEAETFLNKIRPLIQESQSALPPVSMASVPPVKPAFSSPVPLSTVPSLPPAALRQGTLLWHWLCGGLLTLSSLVCLLDYFIVSLWPTLLSLPLTFGLLLCPLVALIRQRQGGSSARLAMVSWLGIGYSLFILVAGYAGWIYLSIRHPDIANDQFELIKLQAALKPGQSSYHTVMTAIEVVLSSCLGFVYLWFTFQEKEQRSSPRA